MSSSQLGTFRSRTWPHRLLVPLLVAVSLAWIVAPEAGAAGRASALPADGPAGRVMTVTGTTIAASSGAPFSGQVATLSLGDTSATSSQFSASIDWGDATTESTGTVTGPTGGPFAVNGSHTYAATGSYATTVTVVDLTNPPPGGSYQLAATTVDGPNQSGTGSNPLGFATATASCPPSTVLVSGGGVVEPVSADVSVHLEGSFPSDAAGHPVTVAGVAPQSWTALSEDGLGDAGNVTTAWALCATGGPTASQVALTHVQGPNGAGSTSPPPTGTGFTTVTASCPAGTTLTGGGVETIPGNLGVVSGQPSPLHVNASYPSDANAGFLANGTAPTAWTGAVEEGNDVNGTPTQTVTTAFAVCSTTPMTTQVESVTTPGPFGAQGAPQNVVTATAGCPAGTDLLGGGGVTEPPSASNQPSPLHLDGAYPSSASGALDASGTPGPSNWSGTAREGNDVGNPPGTGTFTGAFTLCSEAGNQATGTGSATVSSAGSGPAVQVAEVTAAVTSAANSASGATAGCPGGTVLIGGGVHAYFGTGDSVVVGTTYEPINGLVIRGSYPSDTLGNTSTASDPVDWTGLSGFAGQNESGDDVAGYAMCASGLPATTITVVSATVNGPTVASTTAATTATCPGGTTLVGGGALMGPNGTAQSTPSQKPVGSYPSDPTGSTATVTNPNSWTAVGNSAGQLNLNNFTTAFALCASGLNLQTQVVRADDIGHPAGQGNSNPGQDPVATATATCPGATSLLDGGMLADSSQPAGLQQGVHMRGDYPSDALANPAGNGPAPNSWSAVEQSGGQATPGTNTHAFALCAGSGSPSSADMALTDAASPTTAPVGGQVSYTLTATNNGPSGATGVAVTETLAAGETFVSAGSSQGSCSGTTTVLCTAGTAAVGASVTVTVVATATQPGTLTDAASTSAGQPDPDPSNNAASAPVSATAAADLALAKTASPTSVTQGGQVTYTLVASDNGPSPSTGVTVTDPLPAGEAFVSAAATQGSCTGGPTVSCALGGLSAGGSATATVVVAANTSATVSNTASVAGNEADPNPANNTATASVVVNGSADLVLTKTASPTAVTPGGQVTYTMVATDNGPGAAASVSVSDPLPTGETLVSDASTAGSCTGPATISCSIGTLAGGSSATVTVVTSVTGSGTLTNTATASSTTPDPNPSNNTATASITVGGSTALTIVGTVTDATSHAPLAGVCVYPYAAGGGRTADPGVCTNASGNFILPMAAPGSYDVAFFDPSGHYLTQWYNGAASQAGATTVILTSGAAGGINAAMSGRTLITGTVTAAGGGVPLAGVCVYLYTTGGARTADPGTCSLAGGSYAMAVVSPGSYDVAFTDPSGHYLTQWYNGAPTTTTATPVVVTAGATTAGINAAMAAPTLITGTVTASGGGGPLAGVCVYLYTTGGARTADPGTCSLAGGSYAMAVVSPGSYDVAFTDPSGHYATQWYNGAPTTTTATPVVVTAGATTPGISAGMSALQLITGTVTDAGTGQPLPGVCVYLYTTGGQRTSDTGTCTLADGTYAMSVASSGTYDVAFLDPSGVHVTSWYLSQPSQSSANPVSVSAGATTPNVDEAMQP